MFQVIFGLSWMEPFAAHFRVGGRNRHETINVLVTLQGVLLVSILVSVRV